jgi:hypothetical protein
MGSGAVLGLAPAPEYTFLIYVSPVGNYFKVIYLHCYIRIRNLHDVQSLYQSFDSFLFDVNTISKELRKGLLENSFKIFKFDGIC